MESWSVNSNNFKWIEFIIKKKILKWVLLKQHRGPLISTPYTKCASTGHLHSSNLESWLKSKLLSEHPEPALLTATPSQSPEPRHENMKMGYVQIRPWAGMDQDSQVLGSPSPAARLQFEPPRERVPRIRVWLTVRRSLGLGGVALTGNRWGYRLTHCRH